MRSPPLPPGASHGRRTRAPHGGGRMSSAREPLAGLRERDEAVDTRAAPARSRSRDAPRAAPTPPAQRDPLLRRARRAGADSADQLDVFGPLEAAPQADPVQTIVEVVAEEARGARGTGGPRRRGDHARPPGEVRATHAAQLADLDHAEELRLGGPGSSLTSSRKMTPRSPPRRGPTALDRWDGSSRVLAEVRVQLAVRERDAVAHHEDAARAVAQRVRGAR